MLLLLALNVAQADTFLYDTVGALVSTFGEDGKSVGFQLDAAQNVSASSTSQPVTAVPGWQVLLTVPVVPQTTPDSTGISATADLSALGGSPSAVMNDSGVGGDAVAGDGIYSVTANIGPGTVLGPYLVEVTFTDDQDRTWTDIIAVNVQAQSAPSDSNDIPTLPEWGMILLAALLVLLAVRNLPSRGASGMLAIGLLAMNARAQEYPIWENAPMDFSVLPIQAVGGEAPAPLPPAEEPQIEAMAAALSVPQEMDAEVTALAAALGDGQVVDGEDAQAKAVRIFNWVRNNIDYEHYHGLRKGSALTLLEGSGNDFDQSVLLADLLVAAGYPASNVKLRLRGMGVEYSHLVNWMGLASEPFPGKNFLQVYGQEQPFGAGVTDLVAKQLAFSTSFVSKRGSASVAIWNPPENPIAAGPDGKAVPFFDRMFVQLTMGGVVYDLDPSYKAYEKITAVADLMAAAGYSRSNLLSTAEGTSSTSSYAVGLSQTNVTTYLNNLTTTLLGQLGTTYLDLSVSQLLNGRRIIKHDISSLSEAFPLSKGYYYGTNLIFNSSADQALDAYKTKVRFQYSATDGIDYTIPTADLKGRKITLTFSGNTAELRLDDGDPVDTGTVPGTSLNLTITVTHPGALNSLISTTGKTETKTYQKSNAYAYALIYGFSASNRLLQKRQAQLKSYLDSGLADDSREVRTEILNVMGLTWLYQTELATRLLAAKNRVIPIHHHRFGRMGQEAGYYVDVGLQYSGIWVDDGESSTGRFDNVFHLGSLYASAMEHGIIEQMQPGSSAVSTVNILRTANTSGQRLYQARADNWSSIQSSLPTYSSQFSSFESLLSGGAKLFLPQTANVTQGNWTGSGWVIRSSSQAGMIINGGYSEGYSGGYSTSTGMVASAPLQVSVSYSPSSLYVSNSIPLSNFTLPSSTTQYYASDPVDMATGAFVYASEDMTTGLEETPRGLSFVRNYSSNLATRDEQNLGHGWTHNFHIRVETRTADAETLGLGAAQAAAPFLASMVAAMDLYRADATPREWGVAVLAVGWLVDAMKDNAVSVRMGKEIFQFIKQPDGTYTPPPGSTMRLWKVPVNFEATEYQYRLQQRLGNTINFNTAGKASSIADMDGKTMSFNYNTNGTLNYVQDAYGRRYTFGYNGTHITSISDNTSPARSISFGYDTTNWNLTSATDPEGKVSYFDYAVPGDPGNTTADQHRIVRLRNHDNETITQNVWDSLGRVERQFLHGDTNKTFRLYYTGRDNYEVNPQGGITHYYYDERGRASGTRDSDGNVTAIGYDGQDRMVSRTTGANETTVYHYDNANNLTQIDHPRGGGSTSFYYDSLHRIQYIKDPNSVWSYNIYYPTGTHADKDRPQTVYQAVGTSDQVRTDYTYHQSGAAIGRIQTITEVEDNLVISKTYDSYGQPDITTLPGGFTINENYSARGDLDSVVDPNAKTTSYSYNLRRQVIGEIVDTAGVAATSNSTFDNQARVATVTPPADNGGQRPQESRTYNPTDKVRLQKLNGVTLADTAYDSRDWLETVKDAANRTTILVRKANGVLSEAQRPGSRTTKFSYDGDNRVTGSSNPGSNSGIRNEGYFYTTTPGGLPRTVKTEADGRTVTSDFDAKGQLRFLKDRKGATFEFRYDGLGRRTHVITPQGQATITSYKKNGRVASVSEPSGDTATFNYNATTGRLASVVYSGTGGGTVNYTSYDANGNLLTLNENGSNGISRTYDGLNRVTSYTFGGQTIGYRYYPSGKLAKLIYPGGSENGVGHVEYTYNADGRLYQVIDKLDSTSSHARRPTPGARTGGWNPFCAQMGALERLAMIRRAGRKQSLRVPGWSGQSATGPVMISAPWT